MLILKFCEKLMNVSRFRITPKTIIEFVEDIFCVKISLILNFILFFLFFAVLLKTNGISPPNFTNKFHPPTGKVENRSIILTTYHVHCRHKFKPNVSIALQRI